MPWLCAFVRDFYCPPVHCHIHVLGFYFNIRKIFYRTMNLSYELSSSYIAHAGNSLKNSVQLVFYFSCPPAFFSSPNKLCFVTIYFEINNWPTFSIIKNSVRRKNKTKQNKQKLACAVEFRPTYFFFVRPLKFVLDDIPNFFYPVKTRSFSEVYGDIVKSNVYRQALLSSLKGHLNQKRSV